MKKFQINFTMSKLGLKFLLTRKNHTRLIKTRIEVSLNKEKSTQDLSKLGSKFLLTRKKHTRLVKTRIKVSLNKEKIHKTC